MALFRIQILVLAGVTASIMGGLHLGRASLPRPRLRLRPLLNSLSPLSPRRRYSQEWRSHDAHNPNDARLGPFRIPPDQRPRQAAKVPQAQHDRPQSKAVGINGERKAALAESDFREVLLRVINLGGKLGEHCLIVGRFGLRCQPTTIKGKEEVDVPP